MIMKTFSILGAGWLGLELAKTLKDQFTIKLSARNALIQKTHTELGFESYVLTEGIYNNLDALFSCEYLFINYPPSKFNDYLQFINTLSQHPRFSTIEKIFFVSSSSVYPKVSGVYDEKSEIVSSSNPLYYEAERSLHGKVHIIFRCAGLMGADRIAAKYYTNKLVEDGKSRVNHIHRIDVIRAVLFTIDKNLEGIFNLCAPKHPTKEEVFLYQSERCHLTPPRFTDNVECTQRIIDGSKLERLGFKYQCTDPREFINASYMI